MTLYRGPGTALSLEFKADIQQSEGMSEFRLSQRLCVDEDGDGVTGEVS